MLQLSACGKTVIFLLLRASAGRLMDSDRESKLVLGCIVVAVFGLLGMTIAGAVAGWYIYRESVAASGSVVAPVAGNATPSADTADIPVPTSSSSSAFSPAAPVDNSFPPAQDNALSREEAMAAAIRATAERVDIILPDIPVTLSPQPSGQRRLRLRPDRVTVAIGGPPEIIRQLKPSQVICFIDTTRADYLTNPLLRVKLPDQVMLFSISPNMVKIEQ